MISLLLTLILGFASDSCNNKDIILILGYNYNLLGWYNCSYASLPGNPDIRHLRLAPRYVIQIRPSIFKGVSRIYTVGRSASAVSKYFLKSTVKLRHFLMFSVKSVNCQENFGDKICKS